MGKQHRGKRQRLEHEHKLQVVRDILREVRDKLGQRRLERDEREGGR